MNEPKYKFVGKRFDNLFFSTHLINLRLVFFSEELRVKKIKVLFYFFRCLLDTQLVLRIIIFRSLMRWQKREFCHREERIVFSKILAFFLKLWSNISFKKSLNSKMLQKFKFQNVNLGFGFELKN